MIESLDIQILTLINRGFAIFNSAASAFQTLMAAALSSGSIASPAMIIVDMDANCTGPSPIGLE